jgi:methionyl-tRNA synthetase
MIPAHGIYWPIMLHALGFRDDQMPTLFVHGWWNISGAKMSKSLGNVVDPNCSSRSTARKRSGNYLMSDIVTGKDADFSEHRLSKRYNSDLANNLGNCLTAHSTWPIGIAGEICAAEECSIPHLRRNRRSMRTIADSFDWQSRAARLRCQLQQCRSSETNLGRWLRRSEQRTRSLLYHCESLRIIAILISPVLPKAAHRIFDQLNWKMELSGKEERFRLEDATWGGLPDGHVVGKPSHCFRALNGRATLCGAVNSPGSTESRPTIPFSDPVEQ